ncbi:hypothetical protein EDD36DRAFT_432466 [Exophiala viscosa]|uniref:Uncharacterized protein n=1 Tax=Exophiala viscosa TaxID=2486360 RepID=A0AAN6E239_9EURO|nr:hypothetical protein EDD36DRAFT_432466 [Exophiala viscosa]
MPRIRLGAKAGSVSACRNNSCWLRRLWDMLEEPRFSDLEQSSFMIGIPACWQAPWSKVFVRLRLSLQRFASSRICVLPASYCSRCLLSSWILVDVTERRVSGRAVEDAMLIRNQKRQQSLHVKGKVARKIEDDNEQIMRDSSYFAEESECDK